MALTEVTSNSTISKTSNLWIRTTRIHIWTVSVFIPYSQLSVLSYVCVCVCVFMCRFWYSYLRWRNCMGQTGTKNICFLSLLLYVQNLYIQHTTSVQCRIVPRMDAKAMWWRQTKARVTSAPKIMSSTPRLPSPIASICCWNVVQATDPPWRYSSFTVLLLFCLETHKICIIQATMWDGPVTQLLGMSAKDFNDLSQVKFKDLAGSILDVQMVVKMYIANKHTSFPTFTIKEASFA